MPQRKAGERSPSPHWSVWLQESPRRIKQLLLLAIDWAALPLILMAALSIRFGDWGLHGLTAHTVFLSGVLMTLCFVVCHIYSAVVRAFDEHFLQSVMLSSVGWSVLFLLCVTGGFMQELPRSIPVMSGFLLLLHVWLSRAAIRGFIGHRLGQHEQKTRLMVYGAGQAGRQLLAAAAGMSKYRVLGFLDDNPQLVGTHINGLPVFAGFAASHHLAALRVDEVIVAIPSETRVRRREIVHALEGHGVYVRLLPGLDQIMAGQISLGDVREVDILDLLGRDPMPPDLSLFQHHIKDRVVMVTGAAGSIGSELCRQILTAHPASLILFDHSEFGLYAIDRELRERFPDACLIPVLGSVLQQQRLQRVMQYHHVETVYHAAAYKHVPLVEANPFEGVRNNSLGTYRAALAARDAGVEVFVLVSTDKAVRPTNVMGASKRLSELALQALAAEPILPNQLGTCFSMVRFGNVLGSSGSVVPVFRQQIADGGPVTLTHADITRFFMTIPEAAQLVIQAGGMAQGGEVFLLEMGEAVRILDLARQMIRLSGLTERTPENPDGDIEIVYTGLRPGEKLYEELLINDAGVQDTEHPLIYKAHEDAMSLAELDAVFAEIELLAAERDTLGLKRLLLLRLPGYKPDFSAPDHSACLHDRRETHESIAYFEQALQDEMTD
ncbi:MAG: nucleoside-diphosphate sugar epimerase/dehydratase [Pseudomonadota bacterium]